MENLIRNKLFVKHSLLDLYRSQWLAVQKEVTGMEDSISGNFSNG